MSKCEVCKEREAIWARQYIAEARPSFYTLGSHIRGFHVTKVCDECKRAEIREYDRQIAVTA